MWFSRLRKGLPVLAVLETFPYGLGFFSSATGTPRTTKGTPAISAFLHIRVTFRSRMTVITTALFIRF